MKSVRFEVYEDVGKFWRWKLIAANGEIVAQGESHTRRNDAVRAACAVREQVAGARIVMANGLPLPRAPWWRRVGRGK